jgi:hypothetical protein
MKMAVMLAGWKTLDAQNNSLTIYLLEDEGVDDHQRGYWMDTVVRQKQVICWPNLVSRKKYFMISNSILQKLTSLQFMLGKARWKDEFCMCYVNKVRFVLPHHFPAFM